MKKIMYSFIMIALLVLLSPISVNAESTTNAKEYIDIDKKVNLSIEYNYDDLKINNVDVKIYYVASVSEDFQFKLASDFNKYSIKLNGIKNVSDWDRVKQTLESYIVADKIDSTLSLKIKNNAVFAKDLKAGLYLVVTENIDEEDYILQFDSFLISLPNLNADGYFEYDVKVEPKPVSFEPKYEEITYTVIKQWDDDKEERPTSVVVEIYKDGNFVEQQTLSSENSWMYTWNALEDGSQWTVVERDVPEGYHVFIFKDDYKFTVINTIFINPGTSDNITNSVLIFIISFVVLIGVIAYLTINRRK